MKNTKTLITVGLIGLAGVMCANAQSFEHSTNASMTDPDPNTNPEPPAEKDGGIGYKWTIDLTGNDSGYVTGHVGAWSWEDDSLFDSEQGEDPVGWTHTSNWAVMRLSEPAWVTIRHERMAGVPWPSAEQPDRLASTANMNPSFTIWSGYDGDGADSHTYNNRGNVSWAEDITYLDHIDNNSKSFVEKTWYLQAGDYTLALGSNATSNDTDRQGYKTTFSTSTTPAFASSDNAGLFDPHPNGGGEGGVGYKWTVELDATDNAFITGHVGAWSWEDDSLFSEGEDPVGWTHTSNWLLLRVNEPAWVTVRHQRKDGIPWPSAENPDRTASTANMNPSFTIFAGYDGTGSDGHTYNNHGDVAWAEGLTYLDHVDNNARSFVEKSWYLEAGDYTLALGSNATSNDTDRQGYETIIWSSVTPVFAHTFNAGRFDPHPNITPEPPAEPDGGVGYTWTIELTGDDTAEFEGHVGAWSWQDEALFDPGEGEEPVGWTHTSNWAFITLLEDSWLTVRHERHAGVPWPSAEDSNRVASTATMNPSFTLFAGYDGDGGDAHTFNNDGDIAWAEDLTYSDHVNNTTTWAAEKLFYLPAGKYTVALGSNAPSNDTARQGYRTVLSTSTTEPAPSVNAQSEDDMLTLFWRRGLEGYELQSNSDGTYETWSQETVIHTGMEYHAEQMTGTMKVYRLKEIAQ